MLGNLWLEVLKRLPTKLLGQCKTVCKFWQNIIESHEFRIAYLTFLRYCNDNQKILVRHFCEAREEHYTIYSADAAHQTPFLCPFKTHSTSLYFRIVGTVLGVICLFDDITMYTNDIILWNPFVHRHIRLPEPINHFLTMGLHTAIIGFGFDWQKSDFKVLRIAYPQFDGLDQTPPRVELYSVDGGTWKEVPAGHIKYCMLDFSWSQWFLKGAIHLLAYERGTDKDFQHNILLVFDVSLEKFMKMQLPLELAEANPARLVVSETRGFLSILHYELDPPDSDTRHCHIWVKKEYTRADSWSKVAQVDFGKGWSNILSLGANNRVLGTSDGELVLGDIDSDMFHRLGVKGRDDGFYVCPYVDTVALLDKDNSNVTEYKSDPRCAETSEELEDNEHIEAEIGDMSESNKIFWGKTSLLPTWTVHEFYVEFVKHQERSPACLQELRQRHVGLSWGNEDATRPTTLTLFACLLLCI